MKICLACSGGGHLSEMMQLRELYGKYAHYFVSDHRQNSDELGKKEKVFFTTCPRRNPLKFASNFFQSLKIFFDEMPDAVISTGADTAFATCILAKLFGKKLIFIESFCRVSEPSLTGKWLYGKADLFLVQWPENKKFFPKAKYAGSVF